MNFFRKFGLVLAAGLLPVFLFSFGFTLSVYQVLGTSDHIKGAFDKSGAYNTVISDLLDKATKEKGDQQGGEADIPVDRPEVKQIVNQAASPEFLKSQTEGFLDGIYAWARGDSKQLNIQINLTDAKTKLADGLAQYAASRAATLPACTAVDLNLAQPGDFDVMNAPCLPPGTDVNAAAEKIRQEINSDDFLKDPVITQDDLKNDKGQTIEEQLGEVPGVFDKVVRAMWISGLFILLLSAAIVALSRPWRAGVKRVGITFISVGGSIAVLALVGSFVVTAIAEAVAKEGALQSSLAEIIKILFGDFRNWWLGYGLVLVALGIAKLVSLKFIKVGKKPEQTSEEKPDLPEKTDNPPHEPKNPHITKTV